MIREVAKVYKVSEESIFRGQRGKRNEARPAPAPSKKTGQKVFFVLQLGA